jgi:cellulose synthase/poly-beta-1,6-N-acetylglucosamine synthase-like glycosyltransferase
VPVLEDAWTFFGALTDLYGLHHLIPYALKFVPFVLFFELPLYFIGWMGVFRQVIRESFAAPFVPPYYPRVSCLITCYSEGLAVQNTVLSLLEQLYPGHIEIIAMVDGVRQNRATYEALKALYPLVASYGNRSLQVVPKLQRGGRVSSMNAGLSRAKGEIFMALDGDTSFDNQMVDRSVLHFRDPDVVALSGVLRVRNTWHSLVTRLQSLEYMLSIHVGKLGLAEWNAINNVPGAFGIFRKSFIQKIGGWNTGTAEDLDLTLRIKQYLGRHPHLRIGFERGAVAHTEAPASLFAFFRQRLRWDGDLSYIYFNKHRQGISPRLMGWRNFIMLLWYGVLFQIVMPFVIVLYTIHLAVTQAWAFFVVIVLLIYAFYLGLFLVQFLLYLFLLSDRKWEDCNALWVLPMFPLFQFCVRVWSSLAILNELFNKGHLDSVMAPWWVLRKGKP